MALVHAIGVSVRDFTGDVKSITLYMLATASLSDVQTAVTAFIDDLDPVIDGKPIDAQVTIKLTVPTVKADPVEGNTVREGALLSYSAADTAYKFSPYIPSWENAGFADNTVLDTGDYGTLEGQIAALFTDRDGNALDVFISGKRAFRK